MTRSRRVLVAFAALLGACLVRPAPDPERAREDVVERQQQQAERRAALEGDLGALEARVRSHPGDLEARERLMRAYFELALRARREQRLREYTDFLERSYEQAFAVLKLEPRRASVHVHMGIVAAYQGDVARARRSFENARRLEPANPTHYLNLAEAAVYLDRVGTARHYLARARRLGSPRVAAEVVELLAAWQNEDDVEQRELFDIAYTLNPRYVQAWNDPDAPIQSLRALKDHCCTLAFCGPNLPGDCPEGALRAALPTLDPETKRRELVLEMLRRRRLREIYEKERELDIVVEPEEPLDE